MSADDQTIEPGGSSLPHLALPPLRIAAFNIQVFGQKKISKKDATSTIIRILQRYDLVVMLEIRDKSTTSLDILLKQLNSIDKDDPFKAEVSERLGRTASKEQYAILYRPSRVTVTDTYQFDDGVDDGSDAFEREPFAVRVSCPNLAISEFGVIAIHTAPTKAVDEINALLNVWQKTKKRWSLEDIIIAGDFNADGDYVSGDDWERISIRSDRRFSWLIQDHVDTTVGRSDASYDRFVVTGKGLKNSVIPGSPQAFKFDQAFSLSSDEAHDVSDHYPIELKICGKKNDKLQKLMSTEISVTIRQKEEVASISAARAVYRTEEPEMKGFSARVVRDGDRKSMLEVIAVKEASKDVLGSLKDFHSVFPKVLFPECLTMAEAYMESDMFEKPSYVYGLCTDKSSVAYDVTVTCRLQKPLTCHVTITKRRS